MCEKGADCENIKNSKSEQFGHVCENGAESSTPTYYTSHKNLIFITRIASPQCHVHQTIVFIRFRGGGRRQTIVFLAYFKAF